MDGDNQRNLLLAIALSVAILFGFQFFFASPEKQQPAQQQASEQADMQPAAPASGSTADHPASTQALDATARAGSIEKLQSREQALKAGPRIMIETPTVTGSISLVGARLDDLVLKRYHDTVDPKSPNIVLLNPSGTADSYFADFGWTAVGKSVDLPGPDTRWQADNQTLTPSTPVTLTWDNGQGLTFEQTYAVDDNYMFTVTQKVKNASGQELQLAPFGLVSRSGTPPTSGYYLLHEGLIGVMGDTLKEVAYKKLREESTISYPSTGGWIGITDKYWMATLVPDQQSAVTGRFVYSDKSGINKYQADFLYDAKTVPAGGSLQSTSRLFAGAKRVNLLDQYRDEYGINKFDRAVDFGWFYFLTKPIFLALHWLHSVVGNFGIAIMILTLGVKLLFFPLANKSYKSMAKMRKLQPQIMQLRERFGDDKQRLNQEVMALYKKEGANPISGCLPVVVQIPVFFSLYKVLFVTIEMRHAPFFGWIHDLSAPDPTTVLNLFGALPWDRPELGALNVLNLGVWPLIMGTTMFLQQRLNPQPADPVQAKLFMFMPIMFTFLLAHFPAGLVIYWSWNNTLSMTQQAIIMKRQGVPFGGKQNMLPTKAGTRAASKGGKPPAKPDDTPPTPALQAANDSGNGGKAAKKGGRSRGRNKSR
ncbi:YidC/Oxa1 family membrane protein insertase [Tistlia consotensis]|uniref:Membrane protein insertase YidC n=1 Tax=Tistlia consotensis USBA 355 TaxID=560819 RepID=A0A1Y6B9N8_9PROT|nr:membrane protein insertase YidC [Tistlia consotensis]SME92059.1 protein translocase subunit yidC [Tistlia consotensis USBA 355]SNR27786.1 YidC/Oxa1 family membrane protein insertase [Tistlia consotensis]